MNFLILVALLSSPTNDRSGVGAGQDSFGNFIVGGDILAGGTICQNDVHSYGAGGAVGCPWVTNTAPRVYVIRPQTNYPGGAQTPAPLVLGGGIDENTWTIVTANNVAGDTFTVTCLLAATATTCTATEGVQFNRVAGDNTGTADALATWEAANCGCLSSITDNVGAVVYLQPALLATNFDISMTSGAEVTQAEGTDANVTISGPGLVRDVLYFADGSTSAPTMAFASSVLTGWNWSGSSWLFNHTGTTKFRITANGPDTSAGTPFAFNGQIQCLAGAVTCADNGAGSNAACTLTTSDVRCSLYLTCSDTQGCDFTLDETSTQTGAVLWVYSVPTNTVACNFADSAGVQETNGGATLALGANDAVMWNYNTDRWIQGAPISNN